MMGLAPSLVVADELASWPPTKIDQSLAALSTSRGKIQGARMLYIGTRAASPDHPFERALFGGLPYAQVHAAGEGRQSLPPADLAQGEPRTCEVAGPTRRVD